MDVKKINDRECIRCGECAGECGFGAICTNKKIYGKGKEERIEKSK